MGGYDLDMERRIKGAILRMVMIWIWKDGKGDSLYDTEGFNKSCDTVLDDRN